MIDFDPEDYVKSKSGRHDSANSDSFSTAKSTASCKLPFNFEKEIDLTVCT